MLKCQGEVLHIWDFVCLHKFKSVLFSISSWIKLKSVYKMRIKQCNQ